MLKISRLIAGLLITIALTAPVAAQDAGRLPLPVLRDVKVESRVAFDAGLYTYIYTVSNPSTNTGEIWNIDIDVSKPPGSLELSSEGFTIPLGATTKSFDEKMAFVAGWPRGYVPMVPVGMVPPLGWAGGLSASGFAGFSEDKDRGGKSIFPGDRLTDLKLISYGLPAIRQIYVEPWWIYVQSQDLT